MPTGEAVGGDDAASEPQLQHQNLRGCAFLRKGPGIIKRVRRKSDGSTRVVSQCYLSLDTLIAHVQLDVDRTVVPKHPLHRYEAHDLIRTFPLRYQSRRWRNLYSTELHGYSIHNMYKQMEAAEGAAVLLIEAFATSDPERAVVVFGAFLSDVPTLTSHDGHHYFGSRETYVFTVKRSKSEVEAMANSPHPSAIRPYHWTTQGSTNEEFITCGPGHFAVGGGGSGPAIRLQDDLQKGTSSIACPTFNTRAPLIHRGNLQGLPHVEFTISSLTIWSVETKDVNLKAHAPQATIGCHHCPFANESPAGEPPLPSQPDALQ